ncbi:MAG: penicillin-binding protein activator [Nitrosomonadales bacterium]|nr:penicillin-binding protein activator [Nitrosomonadales bacterium]
MTLFVLNACTTPAQHAPVEEKPVTPVVVAPVEKPAPVTTIIEAPAPLVLTIDKNAVPHIALILPLKSKDYGSAADAVQQGFLAAANQERHALPIYIYSDFDENTGVVAIYQKAIASGARGVVGPLTRSGVSALAAEQNIPVPTLALNIVEDKPAQQLYYFGMAAEAEARQVGQLAKHQGLHQAIVITTHAQLTKRLQSAFEEEWLASGGEILREIEYNNISGEFSDIAEIPSTAIFLFADAKTARLIHPYLPNKLPIYATSQIFSGNDNTLTNYDLNGIRFIDMPWLLQPDHAAVMTYPRANVPLSIDRERLYALGIDAFRLIRVLLSKKPNAALPLDGVTGDIHLRDHIFQRTAISAVFQEGHSQLAGVNSAPPIQVFPSQNVVAP